MLALNGKELEAYKKDVLRIQPDWNERDFTSNVRSYLDGKLGKVLAVSGLRGTGKTVGILQAAKDLDILYVLTEKNEPEKGKDYIKLLENAKQKYVVFDEYSWIEGRQDLDDCLITFVQHGKRIVLTATESITLDFLNYGPLIHRIDILHTTMFPYKEYLRMYNKEHSKATCEEFLREGGLFKEYAIKNFASAQQYIDNAIVKNLAGYLSSKMSEEKARTLTYAVLYEAVCPSNLKSIPTLRGKGVSLPSFFNKMNVNTSIIPDKSDLKMIADIFEQTGIIVRIPNFNKDSKRDEQYYITNPSLTCQLISNIYGAATVNKDVLGHVFESCIAVQLFTNKLSEHNIYFFYNGGISGLTDNKELDLVITDKNKTYAYFFECKYAQDRNLEQKITLLSGYLEKNDFKDISIEGRYVVYTGKPTVQNRSVGTIILTPPNDMLDYYFNFERNVELITNNNGMRNRRDDDSDNHDISSISTGIKKVVDSLASEAKKIKGKISGIITEEKERISKSFAKMSSGPAITTFSSVNINDDSWSR